MKNLTTILMLIGMALSIGTVQGQILTLCHMGDDTYSWPSVQSIFSQAPVGQYVIQIPNQSGGYSVIYWQPSIIFPNNFNYEWSVTNGFFDADTIYVLGPNYADTLYGMEITMQPEICLATTDSTSSNVEIKLTYKNYDYGSVDLYRYVTSTTSVLVGTIDTSSLTITDTDVNVQSTSYSYYVEVAGCPISDAHNTIYLSQGPGSTGVNLEWTEYTIDGLSDEIDGYTVWKYDTTTSEFVELISVIGLGYTDFSGTSDDVYFIEATKIGGCADNPYARLDGSQGSIVSNLFGVNFTGIDDVETTGYNMVNPSAGLHLTIDKAVDVDVFDLNGRLLRTYNQVSQLNDDTYTNGMYLVVIKDDVNWIANKLIVN